MKKVGVVTIYDKKNYGNRLQNYAVQEILHNLGYLAISIRNVNYSEYVFTISKLHVKKILENILFLFFRKKKQDRHRREREYWCSSFNNDEERAKNFERFEENIEYCTEWLTEYQLDFDVSDYVAFVVGSDQVFNYRYGRANRVDFLSFAFNRKRIALSASMGVEHIPYKILPRYKHYLKIFDAISVREETAEDLLNKILPKKHVITLIDPTMVISILKWNEMADLCKYELPQKYIVCMYFGGGDKKQTKAIIEYAKKTDNEIIWLNNEEYPDFFKYGPYEFLKVIRDANMVFTDSFHTCVFSMLFHTNFYATRRIGDDESIFSRIECLLKKFEFEDRIYNGNNCCIIEQERFVKMEQILELERTKVYSFLNENL